MFVLRTCGVVGLALVACVGTNPAWDGPPDAIPDVGDDDDDTGARESGPRTAETDDSTSGDAGVMADETHTGGADDTSGTTGAGTTGAATTGAATTGAATTTAAGSTSASTSDDGAPVCEDGQALCDGECKDITKDKHACGVECIDCTKLFDDHASCVDGECDGEGEGKRG